MYSLAYYYLREVLSVVEDPFSVEFTTIDHMFCTSTEFEPQARSRFADSTLSSGGFGMLVRYESVGSSASRGRGDGIQASERRLRLQTPEDASYGRHLHQHPTEDCCSQLRAYEYRS